MPEEGWKVHDQEPLRLGGLESVALAETMSAMEVVAVEVSMLAGCIVWAETLSQNGVELLAQVMQKSLVVASSDILELVVMVLTIYCLCRRLGEGALQATVPHCFRWTYLCFVVDNSKNLYTVVDVDPRAEVEVGGDGQV